MQTFKLTGRILFLSESAELVRRQLAGESFRREDVGPLRDNVSTDEITPTTRMLVFDERLALVPYVGLKCGNDQPVPDGAVKAGKFQVTVAGKRYGKGSSREHSPIAEKAAGIQLVVAESFERIYRQNCHNIGLFTSTDLRIVDRLADGEDIPIEELLAGLDELSCRVLVDGGLLTFSKEAFQRNTPVGVSIEGARTLTEKILAKHLTHYRTTNMPSSLPPVGESTVVVADWRFSHEYFTGLCAHLLSKVYGEGLELHDSDRIIAFEDHLNLAHASSPHISAGLLPGVASLSRAHRSFVDTFLVVEHGRLSSIDTLARPLGRDGSEGICHALMAELHALPGQLIVGTDSHTPHAGALGCIAFGAGSTDVASSWVTGRVRLKMPPVIQVLVTEELPLGVSAKDLVLQLLADPFVRTGGAIGAVIEFCGSAVRALEIDDRCTLTNMVAEMGGLTGIVEPDEKTVAFLRERRGIEFQLAPWMATDAEASFAHRIVVVGSQVQTMVAAPGDPGNGIALPQLSERPTVDIAYGGSCTAGKRCDFDQYYQVCAWAHERGLSVSTTTDFYLQFGTQQVRRYCEERGYIEVFEELGISLLEPGCGACANCGPGSSSSPNQVTVSATNRNFPGRSGPGQVWLASPATVAASAFLGRLGSFSELLATQER